MKKGSTILIVIAVIVIGLIMMVVSKHNDLVRKREDVTKQMSNIDTYLQRRMDLIPNLVETVKGYMAHETEVIDKITSARAALAGAQTAEEKSEANNALTSAIKGLYVVVENYPDLKANENFKALQDELAGTENRIATARKDYNDSVTIYNTSVKVFPGSIIAGMFGFTEAEYFEAQAGAEEVPSVSFN